MEEPIQVGGYAKHSFLGIGIIVAIGSSKEVADGVLQGDATFESLGLAADRVRFKFIRKMRRQGRGPKTFLDVETFRDIDAKSLTPVPNPNDDPAMQTDELEPRSVFHAMSEGVSCNTNAFTHGMMEPELAKHERQRKKNNLKRAAVRGTRLSVSVT